MSTTQNMEEVPVMVFGIDYHQPSGTGTRSWLKEVIGISLVTSFTLTNLRQCETP